MPDSCPGAGVWPFMHSDGKVSMSGIYKSGAMYGGMAVVVDLQGRPLIQHQFWLDFA